MAYEYMRENYLALKEEIDRLAGTLGRTPVTLVCVTKSGTDDEVLALAAAGASDMAENRPQELVRRAALLRNAGFSPRFHEIGNLQKNKVRAVLGVCDMIHSVGTLSLAVEIEKQAEKAGRTVRVLMEVNSGREPEKGGVLPEEAEALFGRMRALPHLSVEGLMTMAPATENPEDARPYFRATRELFDRIGKTCGYATATPTLSMGMSGTYRVAIEEGATLVRVGRKLFLHGDTPSRNV